MPVVILANSESADWGLDAIGDAGGDAGGDLGGVIKPVRWVAADASVRLRRRVVVPWSIVGKAALVSVVVSSTRDETSAWIKVARARL